LLTASFRFRLAEDTLAVQLMVPTTKPIADFHRQVTAHAGQTIAKGRQLNLAAFVFYYYLHSIVNFDF